LPKLLDFIKEKGLTHDQVIDMLNEHDTSEPEEETEEEEVIDDSEEDEEIDEIEDDTEIEDNEPEPDIIQISKDELTKIVNEAVENRLKATRKAPSKGKKGGKFVRDKNVVQKNMFEEMV
jgi:hypothetical protein